jgi:CBS domain containing-hemolysin-like protein
MVLLTIYLVLAIGVSFLCSIAEAVILSVSTAYVSVQEEQGHPSAKHLKTLKDNINQPLASILTLNTIAHTVGAAGVGAQATKVFGDHVLGITSAILTFLILVFSEIIPKTLGAHYWRQLAPITAYCLKGLIWILYPFVKMSELLTRGLSDEPGLTGFDRDEFAAMASLGEEEGQLTEKESKILKNLFYLSKATVNDIMTPRTVVFSLPETTTVNEFVEQHKNSPFSRVPVYKENADHINGFVLRSDLLLAQAQGRQDETLHDFCRDLPAIIVNTDIFHAFEEFTRADSHIMMVVNEYGDIEGLITLEDIFETLIGMEIVDESDRIADMQKLARERWKKKSRELGLDAQLKAQQD